MKHVVISLTIILSCLWCNVSLAQKPSDAKSAWKPIASWPFLYETFEEAVVYTTNMKIIKTKANIHIGSHFLWFESKGQRLESIPGQIQKVEFKNHDTYYAIKDKMCKVLREDTIEGKIGRLYISIELDRRRFDEMCQKNMNIANLLGDSPLSASGFAASLADSNSANPIELQPLPLHEKYYMLYKDETFEATDSSIEHHLNKAERKEYFKFIRSDETIKDKRRPMENIWIKFFVERKNLL